PDTLDLKTPVTKALNARPEVIFMSNANRMPTAAREMTNLGYHGPILTTILDDSLIEQAQGQLEGAIFASFGNPSSDFVQKFESHFGRKPGLAADTAYDAVIALSEAIKTSKSMEPGKIAHALASISVNGSAGKFSFDSHRVAKRDLI